MSEITIDEVKDELRKSTGIHIDDDTIQRFIDAAEARYTRVIGAISGTVTEVFDGGGTVLVLQQPVNAITAASYDSGSTLTYTDLTVRNGIVRWGYGTAGRFEYGRVSISYTAPTLPADHREVIIADVAGYFVSTQRTGGRPAFTGEEGGYDDAQIANPVELFPRIMALAKSYPSVA
jgi:hypothetical protein